MDFDHKSQKSQNEQNDSESNINKKEIHNSYNNYQQKDYQDNGQLSQYDEIKINVSQLPPGITEEQVKNSLKGISLKPIKGEIRQEYIPITRMVTEYKEEVYYEKIPRQVRVSQSPINQNNNNNNNSFKLNEKKESKTEAYKNEKYYQTSPQQSFQQSNKSVNYIQGQQIVHNNLPKKQTASPISVNYAYKYKQIPSFQQNQPTYSPVTLVKPNHQINGIKQSFTPISQPTYLNSGFSNAVQYVRQPVQQAQIQGKNNGASVIGYFSPQSYIQAPQSFIYKKY